MPKENVNGLDGRAAVAWSLGKDLQVGVERGPELRVAGDVPAGMTFTGGGPSLFVTLDRAGCNRMIRALRKARDAAFGADA